MKEYLDLLIEYKWRKLDEFAPFISAIQKLPSPNGENIALRQGGEFIDVYKTLVDENYELWIKDILMLSILGTPVTAYSFFLFYLGVTEPDKTELNTGMCEVHEFNVSTTRWR